jgi:hypothetical protein
MSDHSRRKFLKQIGAVSALFLTGRTAFSFPNLADQNKDFEMLIVGDSIISGQGLREEDKFYTLTKNWLQNEVFAKTRKVNLKNYSHTGARLFLSEREIKALRNAEMDLDEFHYPELNISFPSMKTQIDVAAREYDAEGKKAEDINLIMLTGGLTNLTTAYILNSFKKSKKLRRKIDEACNQLMSEFLHHASRTFPNALITVIGYYPIVSRKSSTHKVFNGIFELYEFPRSSKPLLNNVLTRQFLKILHHKMNKRSKIWFEDSNKALQTAVNDLNKTHGTQKAIFVQSPINAETCFGTKNSLLWGMGKKGRMNDATYDQRLVECTKAIGILKDVKLKFKTRVCELSAIGHPNVEGSKSYAEAIKRSLKSKV